ncbi:PGPGW domain-containing protein [Nocardioides nanhaiensis]|uniref:Integral membrane protein n=1 Tax=Nocardioides nanhaiensis TaxID=1476871 RepID=A0ABP8VVR5_9ACTN
MTARPGGALTTLAGWSLLVVGVALVPLPGPGALVVVAGLRVLAPRHAWAARWYEPAQARALTAVRAGVATRPRLPLTSLGPAWLVVLSLAYTVDLRVPQVEVAGGRLGPGLPLAGTATTVGLWSSAVIASALFVVGAVRWGPRAVGVTGWTGRLRVAAARAVTGPRAGLRSTVVLAAAVGLCLTAS